MLKISEVLTNRRMSNCFDIEKPEAVDVPDVYGFNVEELNIEE
jgi:hypothetical protein